MSKRGKQHAGATMLDLWRPPQGAGDPVGCLATSYTFAPGLFDEQCLARFLEIESEPNREDLAFLLERESRLGGAYAGVLVDYTQAGVEHSLRWDVLPVRLRRAKQHAKLSLLAWTRHIRVVVASANLTEQGYRTNYEVAAAVDLTPENSEPAILSDAIGFLRALVLAVPGAAGGLPEAQRAGRFLDDVEAQARDWRKPAGRSHIRQQLTFTLPGLGTQSSARSSLDEAVAACRRVGGSPAEAWVASPFFDVGDSTGDVAAALCKYMARGGRRDLWLCVPVIHDEAATRPRLAAPKTLLNVPRTYNTDVAVEELPAKDGDGNLRPWHAKMVALKAESYSALMIGSSNFTKAGMGVGSHRNAEANLLTVIKFKEEGYDRAPGEMDSVWPEMKRVEDPDAAEWMGASPEQEEEEQAPRSVVPEGFLAVTYVAGDHRLIRVRLEPGHIAHEWELHACGHEGRLLMTSDAWNGAGRPALLEIPWEPTQPPEKLLIRWEDKEAFLPINVEDTRRLPPPAQLEQMTADDMLGILAASDPSAAYRTWARRQAEPDDDDLDSATPPDLDPLRRHDLHTTFLHRVRHRARILANLRANLQRPVWGKQALEWRLRGMVGVEALADRLFREFAQADGHADEALLTLADLLIVLHEVEYQPVEGALPVEEYEAVFRPFLRQLARSLGRRLDEHRERVAEDLGHFWNRVVTRCER